MKRFRFGLAVSTSRQRRVVAPPDWCVAPSVLVCLALLCIAAPAPAQQFDIDGPVGSVSFGTAVKVLPNGNILVTDPDGPIAGIGAVYLYSPTGTLLGSVTGSQTNDHVGSGGVVVLASGNYLIFSPQWSNGGFAHAGAVTWRSMTDMNPDAVSAANSLVGSHANDQVGDGGAKLLANGNYLVLSPDWGSTYGAITWGNGSTGTAGVVSAANSLVGSTTGELGGSAVFVLSSGNYLLLTASWSNGSEANAGAVTFGNGSSGTVGLISASNSLIGSHADDFSSTTIRLLSNGNYLVRSPSWDNGAESDAGAMTWGSGTTGVVGVIDNTNSLVGTTSGDSVGLGLTLLSGNRYVVSSPYWDNGSAIDAGAVTYGGSSGVVGDVGSGNSLVGSTAGDMVGSSSVRGVGNGNYVVPSPKWHGAGAVRVGAVTWAGSNGITGTISSSNSLVGSTLGDMDGAYLTGAGNGNYLVQNPTWDNGGVVNAGAVTWGDGNSGITGAISPANSLVGSSADDMDQVFITTLDNGNYVVINSDWDDGAVADVGAVTWGNGNSGISGPISAANSLVGVVAQDFVGAGYVTPLSNGNYVVCSPLWDNNGVADAGAATWGNGSTGTAGAVTTANSLVGLSAGDSVCDDGVQALNNGNYVILSSTWNGSRGAATWANGTHQTAGVVSVLNSLVGGSALDQIGSDGAVALPNGSYLVRSEYWSNGANTGAGAVTWGNGNGGTAGLVGPGNSVVGSNVDDGYAFGIYASGNEYLIHWISWDNAGVADAGAFTRMHLGFPTVGAVSAANSLVGTQTGDLVYSGVTSLGNNLSLLWSPLWDNGVVADAGAYTLSRRTSPLTGTIDASNSVLGQIGLGGASMVYAYSTAGDLLVVGRPLENIVTLWRLDALFATGFE